MNTKDIAIIGCGLSKSKQPEPAISFYKGTAFTVYKNYVMENYSNWCIFSSKYGIVFPGDVLYPYDVYLVDMSVQERNKIITEALLKLQENFNFDGEYLFYLSRQYQSYFEPLLKESGIKNYRFPLSGMNYGQRLQFLRTGNSSILDLQNLKDRFSEVCVPGIGYSKKFLIDVFTDITQGRYSVTYTNRRIKSLTVNVGDAGMKNIPIFEKHDDRYYLIGSYKKNKLF